MKMFIDANVIVSVLNKEYPLFSYSSRVLSLSGYSRFTLFTSPVCLAIAFYFSEKKSGNTLARNKIKMLCKNISITDTGEQIIRKTITNKQIHDFEDGIEYYSALGAGCKYIVTENTEDFYFSEIEVLTSEQFIEKFF